VKLARLALFLVVALVAAGCGDDSESTTTDTETTTVPAETTQVRVYFLRDGKVWPAAREVSEIDTVEAAVGAVLAGPTGQEQADLGFTTDIPAGFDAVGFPLIADAPQRVEIAGELSQAALAQLVYTATQFPEVEAVVNGETMTRADFEDQTPAILVESPLPFEEVTSSVRATGTANTFEANFQYTLTDTDGLIVDENFVTATSGTGTRGTFDFTTDEFEVPFDGVGALIVFESSAEDGSKINLVEIPLRMQK
jgi:germination protein M